MPAIPYVPSDISEPGEIVSAIRARRGGPLLNLDRMLLHSPPFAEGWNQFLGAVRSQLALPLRLRELAICAVGHLNGAEYEVFQHAPVFLSAGGTQSQLQALRDPLRAAADAQRFDATERLVLQMAITLTRDVNVPGELLDAARSMLGDDRQVVELVGVIAAYNMVSRFLVALQVGPE
ncbi:MAG: carboxymuconolactone decarboxylase family protein [Steroidobacteraceae bacterium]